MEVMQELKAWCCYSLADASCCLGVTSHLSTADHTGRATLPIGVKGRRKEEEKKRAVPRAAGAYGMLKSSKVRVK